MFFLFFCMCLIQGVINACAKTYEYMLHAYEHFYFKSNKCWNILKWNIIKQQHCSAPTKLYAHKLKKRLLILCIMLINFWVILCYRSSDLAIQMRWKESIATVFNELCEHKLHQCSFINGILYVKFCANLC